MSKETNLKHKQYFYGFPMDPKTGKMKFNGFIPIGPDFKKAFHFHPKDPAILDVCTMINSMLPDGIPMFELKKDLDGTWYMWHEIPYISRLVT